ncbi:hypothetical protein K1719_031286 [Acacia pycnantha]|nr:hypothetical protein K1719_031286 [Acacia pycnantha]
MNLLAEFAMQRRGKSLFVEERDFAQRYKLKGKMKEQAITVDDDDGGDEEESFALCSNMFWITLMMMDLSLALMKKTRMTIHKKHKRRKIREKCSTLQCNFGEAHRDAIQLRPVRDNCKGMLRSI